MPVRQCARAALLSLSLVGLTAACGGSSSDVDGGARVDSAAPDGGQRLDGASPDARDASPVLDAGAPDADASARDAGPGTPSAGWLSTVGTHIHRDGVVWAGRGVNLPDLHLCGKDANLDRMASGVATLNHRLDVLHDDWHADFVRLVMSADDGSNFLNNPDFRARTLEVLEHAESLGMYVLVTVYDDPTFTSGPGTGCCLTAETMPLYADLVRATGHLSHVLYGLVNEPAESPGSAAEVALAELMSRAVQTIRDTERELGVPSHIVTVQATRQWSRYLAYFVEHPITVDGGHNVVYEVHAYDFPEAYGELFVEPAMTLPILFGELGPYSEGGRTQDVDDLLTRADALQIPYAAWIFDTACGYDLIADSDLTPTDYGNVVRSHLRALVP